MTDANNARFDAEAAAWDQNPDVQLASENALKAILKAHPGLANTAKTTDVIEIGCGTGLLTLPLAQHVRSILAIDASHGMIDALSTKLSAPSAPKNVHPLCVLLEDPEDERLPTSSSDPASGTGASSSSSPRRKYDLAISHLVLHHIPSMQSFLKTIYGTLKPGTGEVLVTDFEDFGPDARAFHPEARMQGVERDGIKRKEIEEVLKSIGFVDVSVEVGWEQLKQIEITPGAWGPGCEAKAEEGKSALRSFPFLVIRGTRPPSS